MSADRGDARERDKARTTVEDARDDDAASKGGESPVVPDYADDDGQSFRGVDEPTVPPHDRGKAVDDEERSVV